MHWIMRVFTNIRHLILNAIGYKEMERELSSLRLGWVFQAS